MMKNIHRDKFENYLKEQADAFGMTPSDATWEKIRKKTRPPSRWPALPIASLFVVSAIISGSIFIKKGPDISLTVAKSDYANKKQPSNQYLENIDKYLNAAYHSAPHLIANDFTNQTIASATDKLRQRQPELEGTIQPIQNNKIVTNSEEVVLIEKAKHDYSKPFLKDGTHAETFHSNTAAYRISVDAFTKKFTKLQYGLSLQDKRNFEYAGLCQVNLRTNKNYEVIMAKGEYEPVKKTALERLRKNSSRFDFRFHITPAVSYRVLKNSEGNTLLTNNENLLPVETNLAAVPSQAIRHKPALGYETGLGVGYKLSNNLSLTGGIQFNISQYYVKAYLYEQQETAKLVFGEGTFTSTVTSETSLRSFNGSSPIDMKNRYYQVSIPFGIDWTAWRSKNLSWGVAGSLQPTYIFDKQPLAISSNLKNYADASSYIRNLNLNASLETYLGFTTGNIRYQIGPQVRYQMLTSLENKSQNRDYLINYGLKLGVIRYLR